MRRLRNPTQKPSLSSGALFCLTLGYILHAIVTAPAIFPRISNPATAPVIAFISSSDPVKTTLCEETWLKRLHSYVLFSSRKSVKTNQVRVPHRAGSLWSSFSTKALFADRYIPHYFSWYIITTDDTYILVDDLMQDLAAFDSDEPYIAVIGPRSRQQPTTTDLHSVIVASRGAMSSIWDKIRDGREGCSVTSAPERCLSDVVHINLRQDAHERYRFHVMRRHFSKHEMRDYAHQHKGYTDDAQTLSMLSDSLISVHNLTAEDFRIFDLLFNRVKVLPKH